MNELNSYINQFKDILTNRELINGFCSVSSIGHFLDWGHSELINQTSLAIIDNIKNEALKNIEVCKKNIKELKTNLPAHPKGSIKSDNAKIIANQIKALKAVKYECLQLRHLADQRKELIESRNRLYNTADLPTIPHFSHQLQTVEHRHPELKGPLKGFVRVLSICMQHQREALSKEDLLQIQDLLQLLEQNHDLKGCELHVAVKHLHETLCRTLEQKQQGLQTLFAWCQEENMTAKPYEDWTEKQKIHFIVTIEQVFKNPFQPLFEKEELLYSFAMKCQDPASSQFCEHIRKLYLMPNPSTNIFWKKMPPLEAALHELSNTPDLKDHLLLCKLDGLRNYISQHPENPSIQHLIVGAGPAGLIRALYFKLQNQNFEIIEKRSNDKTPRPNTLTLGKWEPRELEILFFLGVIPLLESKASFGHNNPNYMEVKVGDLEEALESVLCKLNENISPVQFDTEIKRVTKENDRAVVHMINRHTQEKTTLSPSSLIITDGFKGTTKELIGISRIDLAKPTLVAFSIFKQAIQKQESKDKPSSIQYRFLNGIKGSLVVARVLGETLLLNKNAEQAYASSMEGGPSGISRLPDQDYLFRVLKREEQNIVEENYKNEITKLDQKIKRQEEKNTSKTLQKKEDLKTLKNKKMTELKNYLNQKSKDAHGVLDFLQSVYHPEGHKMGDAPKEITDSVLVDTIISKAERSLVQIGGIPCLVRGDACHTTDPYTGTGCKTAIEEILADQYLFNMGDVSDANPLELSILDWGQDFYQQRMIDAAFDERNNYYEGTEAESRYINLAVREDILTPSEGDFFLRLLAKQKIPIREIPIYDPSGLLHLTLPKECKIIYAKNPRITFSEEESSFAEKLQVRLEKLLRETLKNTSVNLDNPDWKINIDLLTPQENILLQKYTQYALRKNITIEPTETSLVEKIISKLSSKNRAEGWVLYLILQNKKLLDKIAALNGISPT